MMAYSSVRVTFEIGHDAVVRNKVSANGRTHDWELYIRGAENTDIHHFVDKVVFHLHQTFDNPTRVVKEPPYKIQESGYAGFEVVIDVFLRSKHPSDQSKIRFRYFLALQHVSEGPKSNVVKEKYVFNNPSEDFRRRLIRGGGVGVVPDSITGKHTIDDNKNSNSKTTKSSSDIALKKSKKDGVNKSDEQSNQNEFSMLFGAPIMSNKIPCVVNSKSNSKPSLEKSSQQPDKQVHSSSKSSKHSSSYKEKDRSDKDKKDREKDKDADRNSTKKSKEESTKKVRKEEKSMKTSKEENKTSSHHEEKSKKKEKSSEKSSEKLDKDLKGDKRDKEKKLRDEKKKSREKYKDSENNYPSERSEKLTIAKEMNVNSSREEKKSKEEKPVKSNDVKDPGVVNRISNSNTFDNSKKDEKYKHHKHKKEKSKEDEKRDKDEKEKIKEPKENKGKPSPVLTERLKPVSKPESSKRVKQPLKELFEEFSSSSSASGSDSDSDSGSSSSSSSSSSNDEVSVPKIRKPDPAPTINSMSSPESQPMKIESVPLAQEPKSKQGKSDDYDKKSRRSTEDVERKKRKRKSKHQDEESGTVKIGKFNDRETENGEPEESRQCSKNSDNDIRFNDEYISKLKELQRKIISLEDHSGLQRIVQVVAETGQYEITTKTFDFDLCSLDESIVQRLFDFFVP